MAGVSLLSPTPSRPSSTCQRWATSRGTRSTRSPVFVPMPPVGGPMPNPSTGTVPLSWALKPAAVGRGESFRLLFVTSSRDATSADINDYNNHSINDAGAGHSAIQAFKDGFRVIASTEAVDARDNAALTGTGEKIYWMGSNNRVADDYTDLLDGFVGQRETRPTRTGAPRRSPICLDRLGRMTERWGSR